MIKRWSFKLGLIELGRLLPKIESIVIDNDSLPDIFLPNYR